MGTLDHYTEAGSIADAIERQGFANVAENIRTAISQGFSGTEIFMKLRFYLAPLTHSVVLDEKTKFRIQMLHDALDRALS
jgi:hypothetical protein